MRERSLKHERIAAKLRKMVKEKIVSAGGMLPTELELGEMFSCSRGTVRRALETLVNEGLIWRRQGSGSFVRQTGTIGGQGCLGLITPVLLNTEVLRFLNEITLQASRLGYQVLLEVDDGTPTVERCFVDELAHRNAVGVIKFPTMPELSGFESGIRTQLRELHLPHVVINDFWGDPQDSNHILFDEVAAVEMAVDHLYALGHRRIAWADTPHSKRHYALNAYRNALMRRALTPRDEYVFCCYAYAPMCVSEFWPEAVPGADRDHHALRRRRAALYRSAAEGGTVRARRHFHRESERPTRVVPGGHGIHVCGGSRRGHGGPGLRHHPQPPHRQLGLPLSLCATLHRRRHDRAYREARQSGRGLIRRLPAALGHSASPPRRVLA